MGKNFSISGFPEWLPEQKLVEDRVIAKIKQVYASHGFVPIETPAIELLESLASKGVVEREIYVVKRIHAEADEESAIGLHFDLTVPFARYVAQHFNDLVLPFKRYQLQKVWRGERPQKGRFREFYQFDIDIIARDELPLACDAEVVTVIDKAFCAIGIGPHQISINNRKLFLGSFRSFGLSDAQAKGAVIAIDKIHKIGREGVISELTGQCLVNKETASRIVDLASVTAMPAEAPQKLGALGITDNLFQEGVAEVQGLCALLPESTLANLKIDLSLARGLEYYTGALFEVQLTQYPEFGSVCGGGRYNDLASQFINQKLPGVGASIGITRLMDLILSKNLIPIEQRSLSKVLVTVYDEQQRPFCNGIAEEMRAHGVACEVFFKSPKLGKQIEFAEKKGIPFVMFIDSATSGVEVKDLRSKEQAKVSNLAEWCRKI